MSTPTKEKGNKKRAQAKSFKLFTKKNNRDSKIPGGAITGKDEDLPMQTPCVPENINIKASLETNKIGENVEIVKLTAEFLSDKLTLKELFTLLGVSQAWSEIFSNDVYWKNYLESVVTDETKEVVDPKLPAKENYLAIICKKKGIVVDKKQKKTQPKTTAKPLDPVDPKEYYPVALKDLTYKEDPNEMIVLDKDGNVECASVNRLIAELTSPVNYDQHFLHTFMITFRTFTTGPDLMKALGERFNYPPPEGCTNLEFAQFKKDVLDKIRLRITQTIKFWIENFYELDFDDEIKKSFKELLEHMEKSNGGAYTKILARAMEKVQSDSDGKIETKLECPPILNPSKFKFLQKKKHKILFWPTLEIARQITLIEFDMFRRIEPKECLNQNWNKGLREKNAPNISAMIGWFNKLSNWVGTMIAKCPELEIRIKMMQFFIELADKLCELNNFNGVFSIISGLALAAIHRLRKTWDGLDEQSKTIHQKLNAYISRDKNFRNIRQAIKSVKPPCIPYIGLYLTDLTFIDEGNPKRINGLFNFVKCVGFANVIRDMQTYQNTKYALLECDPLKKLLVDVEIMQEKDMYEKSLLFEPRKGAKKKDGKAKGKTPEKK